MVARSTGGPPRLLRAARASPAASRLRPALLLSLQAFDAAVRLQSFKAAAAALHLTPSAVSHRIRNLERSTGSALFTRKHRTVQVTAAGRALAESTGRAFAELLKACEPLAGAEARTRLRLSVSPLFASAWLIPRLPRFMASYPDIELVIESSLKVLDFDNEAVHAGVRVGDGNWAGLSALRLMDLHATPVAAPRLVERLKLKSAADVARAPMIHVSWFPLAWSEWLRQAGQAQVQPKHTIWVDGFEAAVQLAERGAGVALGLSPLFAEAEAAGRLCRPLPQRYATGAYWLVHRPEERANKALRLFKRWLLAELADG
jgi:DNA-binding transcriptional LysR family regulator